MENLVVIASNRGGILDSIMPVYFTLKELGFNCLLNIIEQNSNKNFSNDKRIFIGFFRDVKVENLPPSFFIINPEPIHSWMGENYDHIEKLKKATAILHYQNDEINGILKYNKNVFYFPYSYHPCLTNMYNISVPINEDIDVLFMGSSGKMGNYGEHRINTLKMLKNTDINLFVTGWDSDYVYNKDREILIRRAKIILIINFYANNIDTCRTTYLLSNKRFVLIDSWKGGKKLSGLFNNLPCVESDKLYDTINYYLNNKEERLRIIDKNFTYISNNFKCKDFFKKIHYFNHNIEKKENVKNEFELEDNNIIHKYPYLQGFNS